MPPAELASRRQASGAIPAAPASAPAARILSIDAFRGFTMICMLGEGFGLLYYRHHPWVAPIARQFMHVDWNIAIPADIHFWDLIQPFFMFIVGLVMPIAFAKRWAAGETWRHSLWHVLQRSALLVALGLLARSVQAGRPVLDLINVLAQIAFTYLVAFLLLRKRWTIQAGAALALLALHSALFLFGHAPGVIGPWVKNANIGWYLDGLVLHKHWSGSYATINCVSSAANTIFGMMAGQLLASSVGVTRKLRILAYTGLTGIALGIALNPLLPLNKKIWTASFALYSTGFTLLALLLFYWICDIQRHRRWAWLFLVVGSNSIFIYMFHETLHRFLSRAALALMPGPLAALAVLALELTVCVLLYRRKIFIRL